MLIFCGVAGFCSSAKFLHIGKKKRLRAVLIGQIALSNCFLSTVIKLVACFILSTLRVSHCCGVIVAIFLFLSSHRMRTHERGRGCTRSYHFGQVPIPRRKFDLTNMTERWLHPILTPVQTFS